MSTLFGTITASICASADKKIVGCHRNALQMDGFSDG